MKIEQLYTDCLAEAAYYIESNGEAAIIDPLRETKPYTELAEKNGAKIKYIFETHFHADFVSGHVDLAKKTGADIVFGPTASAEYDILVAEDNQEFKIGNITIKVLHTPGHTMESSSFLLIDENGNDHALFSGDTLFLGDVGRPDLAVKTDLSQADLARHLYHSLRTKIMPLADEVIVYPGHGAGSACGKNLSEETVDTLGNQKKTNYALRPDMGEGEFVEEVLTGLVAPPQYFPKNAVMNKMGYESVDAVMARGLQELSANDVEKLQAEGALVVDTRTEQEFAVGHVPNSWFIGIEGNFAPWVGALIPNIEQKMIIIADEGREEEVVRRLARVGYDQAQGFLKGGLKAWEDAGKTVGRFNEVDAKEVIEDLEKINILDVRKESEFYSQRLVSDQILNNPLDFVNSNFEKVAKDKTFHVHCVSGYRSMIAMSIYKSKGFDNLVNIKGGFEALMEAEAPVSEYVCPSTML
ncbi:MAG: rhodanese-like domain-containing protein [Flavobacteriales bacterium]|jgi:glyoxylase-like metal-dependent hydrolase (beta-lactamase superfamily II)/rhodanese-related sulfurtransferase|nr:rhodanese-like domain-containing protein [Flavobacteriales bacterium]